MADISERTENTTPVINPSLVQITASKNEIDRRIAAFIERKQNEVDQNNRREYCGLMDPNVETDGCARTNAVFISRTAQGDHCPVRRVHNVYGPQTRHSVDQSSGGRALSAREAAHSSEAVQARLAAAEAHLGIKVKPVPANVYSRLKDLEERILYLESLSPEYFNKHNLPRIHEEKSASHTTDSEITNMSLTDINSRISALKQSLKQKESSTVQS